MATARGLSRLGIHRVREPTVSCIVDQGRLSGHRRSLKRCYLHFDPTRRRDGERPLRLFHARWIRARDSRHRGTRTTARQQGPVVALHRHEGRFRARPTKSPQQLWTLESPELARRLTGSAVWGRGRGTEYCIDRFIPTEQHRSARSAFRRAIQFELAEAASGPMSPTKQHASHSPLIRRAVRLSARRRPVVLWVLGVLVASITISCNSVNSQDLLGTWTVTNASRQFLPAELKGGVSYLTLSSDGTFDAVDMPGAFHGSFAVVVNSGRGTWKVATVDGREKVQISFSEGGGTQLEISHFPGSQSTLSYFISDPDAGKRVELTRGP